MSDLEVAKRRVARRLRLQLPQVSRAWTSSS